MRYLAVFFLVLVSFSSFAEDEEQMPNRAVYYSVEPAFITNFGVSKKKMPYIKAEVSLRAESEVAAQSIKANQALIRHEILMLLSSQTKDSMLQASVQEDLRKSALQRVKWALTQELGEAGIEDLLFTSFVLQH